MLQVLPRHVFFRVLRVGRILHLQFGHFLTNFDKRSGTSVPRQIAQLLSQGKSHNFCPKATSAGTHVVHRKQLQHAGICGIASDAPAPPLLITSHELPHSPANERLRNCRLAGENGRLPQQLLDGGSPWTWTPGEGKLGAGCVGKDFAKRLLIPLPQLVPTHGRLLGAVCKKLGSKSKKRKEEKSCCPALRKMSSCLT
jgi:hypothetical protein